MKGSFKDSSEKNFLNIFCERIFGKDLMKDFLQDFSEKDFLKGFFERII